MLTDFFFLSAYVTCCPSGKLRSLLDAAMNSILSTFFMMKYCASIPCRVFMRLASGLIWFSMITVSMEYSANFSSNIFLMFLPSVMRLTFSAFTGSIALMNLSCISALHMSSSFLLEDGFRVLDVVLVRECAKLGELEFS